MYHHKSNAVDEFTGKVEHASTTPIGDVRPRADLYVVVYDSQLLSDELEWFRQCLTHLDVHDDASFSISIKLSTTFFDSYQRRQSFVNSLNRELDNLEYSWRCKALTIYASSKFTATYQYGRELIPESRDQGTSELIMEFGHVGVTDL